MAKVTKKRNATDLTTRNNNAWKDAIFTLTTRLDRLIREVRLIQARVETLASPKAGSTPDNVTWPQVSESTAILARLANLT